MALPEILNLGASAASGGLFGLLGTALGRVAGYFERKQQNAFEEKKWQFQAREWDNDRNVEKHEVKLHELNLKAKHEENEMLIMRTAEEGSWKGLGASIQHDLKTGIASQWVINILRLVRPVITLLLWLITAWIFSKTQSGEITKALVFAATASTLWWFGDRAPKRLTDRGATQWKP